MRSARPPQITAAQTFAVCVSGVPNLNTRTRLNGVTPLIEQATAAFDSAAVTTTLHLLPSATDVGGVVSVEEMRTLYEGYLVRRSGRGIYNQLRAVAADGVCLLCGHLRASTLDHHLPKSRFPALAVSPTNLVPCCRDCNMAKIARVPTSANEETLHPYFDKVDDARWLFASVEASQVGPVLHFFVRAPASWSPVLAARTAHHFEVFKLAQLYLTQAQQELANIRHLLVTLLERRNSSGVRDHLLVDAESRRMARLNSWQTAMYEALASSSWFCEAGVLQIPDPKAAA
jgi:hypothetical protein